MGSPLKYATLEYRILPPLFELSNLCTAVFLRIALRFPMPEKVKPAGSKCFPHAQNAVDRANSKRVMRSSGHDRANPVYLLNLAMASRIASSLASRSIAKCSISFPSLAFPTPFKSILRVS